MCDIIWCKKEKDGKPCDTVNYLDPYCFWNWEGKIACAGCNTVYYIHMINGHMYTGPEEKAGAEPDIRPLYADKPLEGYEAIPTGTEGKTRPYHCLPRDIYLGRADMVKFSARGRPVRGWRPQPPSRVWPAPAVTFGILRSSRLRFGPSIKKRSPKAK